MPNTKRSFFLSDSTYNYLKTVVQLLIPAFASFYFGLAGIWGLPNAENVVGTSALLATFLGVVLRLSSRAYAADQETNTHNGDLVVTTNAAGGMKYMFEFDGDPGDIAFMDKVSFRVVSRSEK